MKNINISKKVIGVGILIVILPAFFIIKKNFTKPTLTIIQPEGATFSVQSDLYTIEGNINPVDSKLTINNKEVTANDSGNFKYDTELKSGHNFYTIELSNKNNENVFVEKRVVINRLDSEEEKAEKLRAKEQKEAEAQIELEKYYTTKEGKICKENPMWTKSDCEKISNGKIWIGMSLDMLKYTMGKPSVANPSNYGNGVSWQWCWNGYTPNCFYGDDDGIIDSYN